MKLYYCETLNPRKACAVARYLNAPVDFVRVDLSKGEHKTSEFRRVNPNGKVPVLQDGDRTVWEANAIMCYLSDIAQADLWPHDERQIDVVRWLSWDAHHFTRHAGTLYFENIVKPLIGLGGPDAIAVDEAISQLQTYGAILDEHLSRRSFLVGDSLSVADFAVAVTLPYADGAKLPIEQFPAIQRWHARLNELSAWREPFPAQPAGPSIQQFD